MMKMCSAVLCVWGLQLPAQPARAGDGDYRPIVAAARELSNQLDFMLRALATIPGPSEGRGLYKQLTLLHLDLTYFQQQVRRKAGRELLYDAFDKVDSKLHRLLEELEGFEKWDRTVRLAARRALAADSDLYFALFGGETNMTRRTEVLYRQTLALRTRLEDLDSEVRYLFEAQPALQLWLPDLKAVRRSLTELQRLQKDKATRQELQKQFTDLDRTWEKLTERFKGLPERNYLRLQSDAARLDQALGRIAHLVGVENRRPPLPDPLAL